MTANVATNAALPLSYRTGLVLVLLAGVFWSIMGIVVRVMENPQPWPILFHRSLALTIFLFAFIAIRSRGRPFQVYRQAGYAGLYGGCALLLAFAGSIFSVLNTTVANAMFLFATAPFMAAILGWFILGEAVRRATWIAMAVAIVGVTIMVAEGVAVGDLFGNLAAIGSALGFALFTISLRYRRSDDMLPAVSIGGLLMIILAFASCLMSGQSLIMSANDTLLALILGVFQVGVGLALYTAGSKVVPAAELTLLSMTEVVLGPFWVWLFIGEAAGLYTLVGGTLLLAAIAGNAITRLRHKPPPIVP